jgi:hypothetical protein
MRHLLFPACQEKEKKKKKKKKKKTTSSAQVFVEQTEKQSSYRHSEIQKVK